VKVDEPPGSMKRFSFSFLAGAAVAVIASGAAFAAVIQFPAHDSPTNYTREAFALFVIAMALCGGSIGPGAFNAESFRQLLPRLGIVFIAIVFLCLLASLDLRESGMVLAFAVIGTLSSSITLFLIGRKFS
jgi:hypothetical protein